MVWEDPCDVAKHPPNRTGPEAADELAAVASGVPRMDAAVAFKGFGVPRKELNLVQSSFQSKSSFVFGASYNTKNEMARRLWLGVVSAC